MFIINNIINYFLNNGEKLFCEFVDFKARPILLSRRVNAYFCFVKHYLKDMDEEFSRKGAESVIVDDSKRLLSYACDTVLLAKTPQESQISLK